MSEDDVQRRCEEIVTASVKPPDTVMWRFHRGGSKARAKWHREMLAAEELNVAAYTRLLVIHDPAWRAAKEGGMLDNDE